MRDAVTMAPLIAAKPVSWGRKPIFLAVGDGMAKIGQPTLRAWAGKRANRAIDSFPFLMPQATLVEA
jgi:hypothetical protein